MSLTRSARATLFGGLVLVAAVSCGPKESPATSETQVDSSPSGNVSFMIFGDPAELKAYKSMVAAFEKTYPKIHIELMHIPGQSDYRKRLGTDFAAGSPADVVLINYRRYAEFAAKDVLEPLGPSLATSKVIKEEDFFPQAIAPFKWNGQLYGIPQNLSSLVVYYNKNLFDEAKLPYPSVTWNWDDFVATAKALTKDKDGDGKIDQYGLGTEASLQRLAPFVWQNDGEIVDNPAAPRKLGLSSKAAAEALKWFVDLRLKHKVVPDQIEEESEDSESRFQSGRTAMFLNSRRGVPAYREIKAFDWDVAALPRRANQAGILHADGYFMPKSVKNKAATWTFIEFANSPEGQKIIAESGRTVPSLMAVARSEAFLNPKQKPAASSVFLDTLNDLRAVPVHPAWGEIETIANDEIERAFYGVVSIDEAMKALLDRTRGQLTETD